MAERIVELHSKTWRLDQGDPAWIAALEAGKVLYFPDLPFRLEPGEERLLTPEALAPKSRNVSLDQRGRLKGAAGDADARAAAGRMIGRFRDQARALIESLLPKYKDVLRLAPTSFRPKAVAVREQSWRADDRRMHVDAFPTRPTRGERILRLFVNVNPDGVPRVWRLGEPFEAMAEKMLPRARPYVAWRAALLHAIHVTKSRRGEYDHLMLQLHDHMKGDETYQKEVDQTTMEFPPGSAWICFSDQVSHGVLAGQYMMEQTFHLPTREQYDPAASPLGILRRMTGRLLV